MFEIARALAREGFDVLRFDYRGCGESSGSPEEFTFEDHAEDAAVAAVELERRAGVPCRGMLGLRLGAAVAARAAWATGREPLLVMWEPVADGARYCGELLRTAMANELVDSGAAPRTRAEMEAALSRNESVVVDGHPLTRGMFTSLATVDLAEGGRPTASPVLIMQIDAGRARPPREPLTRLRDAYARDGEADLQVVRAPPVWLRVKRYDWRPAELFGGTLEWVRARRGPLRRTLLGPGGREGGRPRIAERASARGRSPSGVDCEGPDAGADERPVEFRVLGERVAGMAHVPREAAAGAPGVVMLAAGESCRTSLFYVPLARRLAREGWPVLRFDPRGIGDSDGDLGCATLAEVFRKIQRGGFVPDCLAAVDFMERELGVGTSVLTGLCGGAITAVHAAARDPRIVGIAPLELRLEYTPLPRFQFRGTTAQYLSWAQIASSSRRTFFLLSARRGLHWLREALRRMRAAIGSLAPIARLGRRGNATGSDGWFVRRLGPNANVTMLRALRRSLDRGVPALCVFGDTDEPRMFEQVVPGLVRGRSDSDGLLERRVIAGADHNFVAAGSTERLFATLTEWLSSPERPWTVPPRARGRRKRAA
jgi:predicted alpha/beta hydrolase